MDGIGFIIPALIQSVFGISVDCCHHDIRNADIQRRNPIDRASQFDCFSRRKRLVAGGSERFVVVEPLASVWRVVRGDQIAEFRSSEACSS